METRNTIIKREDVNWGNWSCCLARILKLVCVHDGFKSSDPECGTEVRLMQGRETISPVYHKHHIVYLSANFCNVFLICLAVKLLTMGF